MRKQISTLERCAGEVKQVNKDLIREGGIADQATVVGKIAEAYTLLSEAAEMLEQKAKTSR